MLYYYSMYKSTVLINGRRFVDSSMQIVVIGSCRKHDGNGSINIAESQHVFATVASQCCLKWYTTRYSTL